MNSKKSLRTIKFLLPLLALVLLIASAFTQYFTNDKRGNEATFKWYIYNGTTVADETVQSKYSLYTASGEPQDCSGDGMRCAIFAEEQIVSGVSLPNLSNLDPGKTKFQDLPQQ